MEQQQQLHYSSKQKEMEREGGEEFNLREWGLRARMVSRENTISRRFSASNISRFGENNYPFRSNFTISTSTASSPGYILRDEVDPSTYSFTTALEALQARTGCVWECLSPEGFTLNSKWNEAEKYICNPQSGEFPKECLSAKTLSGRSLHKFTSRITMSAPLAYPSSHQSTRNSQATPSRPPLTVPGKKLQVATTRDVGIQSTPVELSIGSPGPTSTLTRTKIMQLKQPGLEARESGKEVEGREVTEGDDRGDERGRRTNEEGKEQRSEEKQRRGCKWRQNRGGCLCWTRKMQREEATKPTRKKNPFLCSNCMSCHLSRNSGLRPLSLQFSRCHGSEKSGTGQHGK